MIRDLLLDLASGMIPEMRHMSIQDLVDDEIERIKHESYESWPHYTGDRRWPVPHPTMEPRRAYLFGTDHWEGEYGRLRRDLAKHMAGYFDEPEIKKILLDLATGEREPVFELYGVCDTLTIRVFELLNKYTRSWEGYTGDCNCPVVIFTSTPGSDSTTDFWGNAPYGRLHRSLAKHLAEHLE